MKGIILKCVGGFYYVEAADAVYECRARGIFRKSGITPVAGDTAYITVLDDETGWLEEIGERRNFLVRPWQTLICCWWWSPSPSRSPISF